MKVQIRYVVVCGVRYARVEDVAAYLRELGAIEETDTRRRLEQAAVNFAAPKEES